MYWFKSSEGHKEKAILVIEDTHLSGNNRTAVRELPVHGLLAQLGRGTKLKPSVLRVQIPRRLLGLRAVHGDGHSVEIFCAETLGIHRVNL